MLLGYGTRNQLNVPELYTLELVMLSYLNWDLNHPTCSYVIELLLQYSISVPDIKFLMKINVNYSFNEIKFWFSKTIKELMDICLSEETMIQTLPSFMAIAILQAWLWLHNFWMGSIKFAHSWWPITGLETFSQSIFAGQSLCDWSALVRPTWHGNWIPEARLCLPYWLPPQSTQATEWRRESCTRWGLHQHQQ